MPVLGEPENKALTAAGSATAATAAVALGTRCAQQLASPPGLERTGGDLADTMI
jgi:hypothetical protein